MRSFFDILSKNEGGVTIEDTYKLFSNHYLDDLFKPEWERFGIKFDTSKQNGHSNGEAVFDKKESSSCCDIM